MTGRYISDEMARLRQDHRELQQRLNELEADQRRLRDQLGEDGSLYVEDDVANLEARVDQLEETVRELLRGGEE